ncbi:metal ABC transporter permease [Oleisolibacter albus]|uniref:metal ABC transporter permease n=1 Tax=Oleisolibacter albus TaxID=2171757 RepID=UPI001EFE9DB3|nr:metal ABC transporter permease [Oleisolibacter albus]
MSMEVWPLDVWLRVAEILTFRAGHNAAVVLAGATLLGIAAGVVGTFTFLRGRALVSDALGHATLPGVVLAFLLGSALGLTTRNLPLLLAGAALTGSLAVWLVQQVSRHTRLAEDAVIAGVLGGFFGLGVVLLSLVQSLPTGGQAGLGTFILGQTAGMTRGEAWTMAVLAGGAALAALALYKEFRLVCFDPDFARGLGWPVALLDLGMLALAVVVTVAGLQTVGLVLVVAFLVIPPVAARFWSDRLDRMLWLAACFGGASGALGTALSGAVPDLPTGAVIVLVAGVFFLVSLLLAPGRGVLAALARQLGLRLRLTRVTLLAGAVRGRPLPPRGVVGHWLRLRGLLDASGRLTPHGRAVAEPLERNLRRWELALRLDPHAVPDGTRWGVDPAERVLPAGLLARLDAVGDSAEAAR